MEKARYEKKAEEKLAEYEAEGKQKSGAGILMGDYALSMEVSDGELLGEAETGETCIQMEMSLFQPEKFLREYEALRNMKDVLNDEGSGI